MMYALWEQRHPQAAAELRQLLRAESHFDPQSEGKSEGYAQQQVRLNIAKAGGLSWRNNVGAMPAKTIHNCPKCHFKFEEKQSPMRWGLCNDSHQLNEKFKSSDVIGVMPTRIEAHMVGMTIGRFLSVEVKKQGWGYTGNAHELAQLAWGEMIAGAGGIFQFSTGQVNL